MANLVISNTCNLSCSYCFARGYLDGGQMNSAKYLSLAEFEKRLDFLDDSGIEDVRLIGGEPTLHPHFNDLVDRARIRGKHIVIFSNGLMPRWAQDCLAELPVEACTVIVNCSAARGQEEISGYESARRAETLRHLGERAAAAYTIATPDFRADFLMPLIVQTGIKKSIRLGLAQPVWNGANRALPPKTYPFTGRKIADLARCASNFGISLEFDCGFVRCMFSADELEVLSTAKASVGMHCSPVLDVGLDAEISPCFPLAGRFALPLQECSTAAGLREAFIEQTRPFRVAGIYKECTACQYKSSGDCTGGCLSATIRQFQKGW
jgi:hypothetical protein